MTSRAELIDEILQCRPEGYFDGARGLLETYVALEVEISAMWRRLHRLRPGTEQSSILTEKVCAASATALELAEALHLLPGDRDLDPPRLQ